MQLSRNNSNDKKPRKECEGNMIICRDFDTNQPITSLDEWFSKCPPAKEDHWKDGRSAKELAKDWTSNKGKDLERLLGSTSEFNGITFKKASPEYKTKLDGYKGNGRQHDLLLLVKHNEEPVLISIEAKTDESFSDMIKDYYIEKIVYRIKGGQTNAPERIEKLMKYVFDDNITKKAFDLRYQLLHAIAGTIIEAKRGNIKRAIFIVNTYCSRDEKLFSLVKHQENVKDLNQFVRYLSKNTIKDFGNDELLGPFNIQGVDLYIMKREKIV